MSTYIVSLKGRTGEELGANYAGLEAFVQGHGGTVERGMQMLASSRISSYLKVMLPDDVNLVGLCTLAGVDEVEIFDEETWDPDSEGGWDEEETTKDDDDPA
jgi:hypothetical protein